MSWRPRNLRQIIWVLILIFVYIFIIKISNFKKWAIKNAKLMSLLLNTLQESLITLTNIMDMVENGTILKLQEFGDKKLDIVITSIGFMSKQVILEIIITSPWCIKLNTASKNCSNYTKVTRLSEKMSAWNSLFEYIFKIFGFIKYI